MDLPFYHLYHFRSLYLLVILSSIYYLSVYPPTFLTLRQQAGYSGKSCAVLRIPSSETSAFARKAGA